MPRAPNYLWDLLLPVRHLSPDIVELAGMQNERTILLTGAGGCIGSALARVLLTVKPRLVLLLDHSEHALYHLETELASLQDSAPREVILGDVADHALLEALLRQHRPDLVIHAAAFKHVPLMEANPLAAIRNNALATWQLAKAAVERGVPDLLLISTDKAANPRSILGASKRLAELAVLRWNAPGKRYFALRLGNVLGSQGSVVRLFIEQIARGGPLTVTHPEVSRYFLTLQETVHFTLAAVCARDAEGVLLPELGKPMRILELARRLIHLHPSGALPNIQIQFIGLRPGDKMSEDLFSPGESLQPTSHPALRRIQSAAIPGEGLDRAFLRLTASLQERDLAAILETVSSLVPQYEPSQLLKQSIPPRVASDSRL